MRYIILAACVIIQVCLGGVYAWSGLVPALKETVGLSTAQTQIIFGGLFAAFTISMIWAGKLLERLGPRMVAGIGGLLFGSGYLIATLGGGHFALMLLGISLCAGVGTGFGYVCPLATGMRWFPNHRGLVTGVAMAGFGGGAVLLSSLVEYLLSGGMHVLVVLQWIGLSYGVVLLVAAAMLKFPTFEVAGRVIEPVAARRLVREPLFKLLVLGMFAGTFAGMLVIGNLKMIALSKGIDSLWATWSISAFAMGNAAGRITWGMICDRTDERVIPLKLVSLALPLAGLIWSHTAGVFIAFSFAVGFGFGACFVVYAAQVASRYGPARVGAIYPLVFLAYGAAGIVGPPIGGLLYDYTSSYTAAIVLSCGVLGLGLLGSLGLLRRLRPARQRPDADVYRANLQEEPQ
jgi:OFA family oxalate/formate antiporter-like MFS transporter